VGQPPQLGGRGLWDGRSPEVPQYPVDAGFGLGGPHFPQDVFGEGQIHPSPHIYTYHTGLTN